MIQSNFTPVSDFYGTITIRTKFFIDCLLFIFLIQK